MSIRIKDIAKELGISESTVSRALSDHPRISIETKKRVRDLVKKLNYRPNLIAKGLKIKETKTIGLIIADITNPFYPEIVKGCEEIANKNGLNIILCNSDYDAEKEIEYINILISKSVDGIIIMPVSNKFQLLSMLKEVNIPLVFIDVKPSKKINVSCIYTDQEYGIYVATKYLINLGHKKIALINGPTSISSCKQIENGYKKALHNNSISIVNNYIKIFDLKPNDVHHVFNSLFTLDSKDIPTAVIFASDIAAVAAYDTIYEKGLKIPEDFSIIGNDDIPLSKNVFPPLTTVSHPKYQMGKKAMEILINKLKNNKDISFHHKRYIPNFMIRKSSAKPRINKVK